MCVSRLVFFSSESRVYFDQSGHSVVSLSLMCFVAEFGSSSSLVDFCQLSAFVVNFDNAAHSGFFFLCVLDVVVSIMFHTCYFTLSFISRF